MKEAFKSMYSHGLISLGACRQAVLDGIINEADYKEVTGDEF